LLFRTFSYPFEQVGRSVKNVKSEENGLYDSYNLLIDRTGHISDTFVFNGIGLFELKSENNEIKYLKALVYEIFDGEWKQMSEEDSLVLPQSSLKEFGTYDHILIQHTNVNTPIIFSAGFQVRNMEIEDFIVFNKDDDHNTFMISNYNYKVLDEEIIYEYDALNLDMNDPELIELLNSINNDMNLSGTIYELPEEYDFVNSITADIIEIGMSDYEKTKRIIDYLKQDYVYNIEPPLPTSENTDRIEFFLETSKEGFCQHFATSAILMLRSEGIPARYVSGFMIDYDIDYSMIQFDKSLSDAMAKGRIPVRDSDSHVWIEVYFKDIGWIPFEATAVSDGITVASSVELESDEEIVEDADFRLSYDAKRVMIIILISLSLGVLIFGLYRVIIYIVRRKLRYKNGMPTLQVMIIFDLINDYLKALDFERYDYETYREYAFRIDSMNMSEIELVKLTLEYENIIYGGYSVDEECRDMYLELLKDIRIAAKAHANLFSVIKTNIKELITL
jgi:hypothetical protein